MLLPSAGRCWLRRLGVVSNQRKLRLFPARGPMLPDCLKQPSERRIEWVLPDLNCRARFSHCVGTVNALVTKHRDNKGRKIPILEWNSVSTREHATSTIKAWQPL